MAITFAPAGKPESFGKRKFPRELPAYLKEFGLNGFEFECGKGVNISEETFAFFAKYKDIRLSVHSPYFISISSTEEETRIKSITHIVESARAAKKLGADRIVVHSGSCAKLSREVAFGYALDTLKKARKALDERGLEDVMICPETMGKLNQLGALEEVIGLCLFDERMLPCVDFGHLNARSQGAIKSQSDYSAVFSSIENKLGARRLRMLHIHFSKIEYTLGGEKRHLTFNGDGENGGTVYGPDYEPLLEEIYIRSLEPYIVCESHGTQAEDASEMMKYYDALRKKK